jgi:NADH-quinone oxidoreductase subunit L
MSQIGYMFVGAGVGAYPAAMFHLMTHAFFKALLFLAAGIVIHALAGEQDIRRMGGLGKAMPFTRTVFWIGALALVGIPFFSGFFSKDAIIGATLTGGAYGYCLFAACVAGALLTGLYTFRLVFLVFAGDRSGFAQEHLHVPENGREGPFSMIWTVAVLAFLAFIGGWLQWTQLWHPLTDWLNPVAAPTADPSDAQEWVATVVALAAGVTGIGLAWAAYVRRSLRIPKPVRLFEKKFYWDELYDAVLYKPADLLARGLGRVFEGPVIGGSVRDVPDGVRVGAADLARAQNGLVRTYVLVLASGVAVLALVFLTNR